MIKFDHFSRFQKDFRQKMQGLHKIDHNSRKKLKTQAKNSRFRQNQKRGLPKIGRKKGWVKASLEILGIGIGVKKVVLLMSDGKSNFRTDHLQSSQPQATTTTSQF